MRKLLAAINLLLISGLFLVSSVGAIPLGDDLSNQTQDNQTDKGPPIKPPGLDIADKAIQFAKKVLNWVFNTLLKNILSR